VVELSVVIPSMNESKNLDFVLPRLNSALTTTGLDYEVLIVDTVNPDSATQEVCKKNAVTYINRKPNNSYGSANRTGIAAAQGAHILIMDADGSHEPEFIHKLLEYEEQYDIVIASRYMKGGASRATTKAIVMSRMLNATYGTVFGLHHADLSNSFKLYKATVLKGLELRCENFDIIQEILVKARRRNPQLKIKEIPYIFQERATGKSKRETAKFIYTYLRTICRLLMGG
jgi:dolichol-phosphate mannosyltransferase